MPELREPGARAKPQSRRGSFHDAMAALINAIAPGTAAQARTNGITEPAEPPDEEQPSAAPIEAPKTYDIQDAIAEVAAVIAPTPRTNGEWQPIATGPLDRDVQVGVTVEGGVLPIFFPCRLTPTGWINAIVKAPLLHEPSCWREWPDAPQPAWRQQTGAKPPPDGVRRDRNL
jgi:hypothetical protein